MIKNKCMLVKRNCKKPIRKNFISIKRDGKKDAKVCKGMNNSLLCPTSILNNTLATGKKNSDVLRSECPKTGIDWGL